MFRMRRHQHPVRAARRNRFQPDLRLVDMRMPVAPPLRIRNSLRHQRNLLTVRRGRRLKLVHIPLSRNLKRRATCRLHPKNIALPRDVVFTRGEVNPLPIRRPAIQPIRAIGSTSAAARFTIRQRQAHTRSAEPARVDVNASLRPIRRVQRPSLSRGMRHQQMRFSAASRHTPYIATRYKCNLFAVRRDCRVGHGRQRRLCS